MIYYLLDSSFTKGITFLSVILAFALTYMTIRLLQDKLPRDAGRAFAINGSKSVGKPRGAGIVFISVFTFICLLFIPVTMEFTFYLALTFAAMLSGFLDDRSEKPWGELKKGTIDFGIASASALTYLYFNPATFEIAFLSRTVSIPPAIFALLIVILVWTSINVTNCTDGIDGLSGTLVCISLFTIYMLFSIFNMDHHFQNSIIIMVVCILAYLWFNASPSKVLMGDAGSRAMGIFVAFAILKSGRPLLFIPVALMLIIDGGLGLLKVSFLRFLKIKILKNTRTPIHDHMRKNKEWSDTQVVFRFAIIQIVIGLGVIYALH